GVIAAATERGREQRARYHAVPCRLPAQVVRGVRDERFVARAQDDCERVGVRELGKHRYTGGPELTLALHGHGVIEPYSQGRRYPRSGVFSRTVMIPSLGGWR